VQEIFGVNSDCYYEINKRFCAFQDNKEYLDKVKNIEDSYSLLYTKAKQDITSSLNLPQQSLSILEVID
jgi:hypothetical protein